MFRSLTLILLTSLLLISCRSTDSFTQRKYLPGFFHSTNHTGKKPEKESVVIPEPATVSSLQKTESGADEIGTEITIPDSVQAPEKSLFTLIRSIKKEIAQPTDSSRKEKRLARKEGRKTDHARASKAHYLGIISILYAGLFFLIGLFLSNGASRFTDDIGLLLLLILIIIPAYFVIGALSLFAGVVGIIFASKVRKNNQGKDDYPENKKTRMAIIMALFGLLLLTFASIVTIPHFLDW